MPFSPIECLYSRTHNGPVAFTETERVDPVAEGAAGRVLDRQKTSPQQGF